MALEEPIIRPEFFPHPKTMGDLSVEWVKSYCKKAHLADNIGSHVLFGVLRKVYELRERAKYAYPEDYL